MKAKFTVKAVKEEGRIILIVPSYQPLQCTTVSSASCFLVHEDSMHKLRKAPKS